MRPNQLATLRELESKVSVGKVRALHCCCCSRCIPCRLLSIKHAGLDVVHDV